MKAVALNRIIGKVHLDSVTDVKQMCDSARLLFSSSVNKMSANIGIDATIINKHF